MSLETAKKPKRRVCEVPKSLNFRYNYLSNSHKQDNHDIICKTLPDNDDLNSNNKETPETDNFDPNKVLSSRLSSNLFFHYRNSFLNEKIMKFNCIKNEESFRTNQSEYIIHFNEMPKNKELILKTEENVRENEEEEFKYQLFHEPEIKFTENTEKNFENSEKSLENLENEIIENKEDNFTVDSKLNDSEIKISDMKRNLDLEDKMKNEFFPVSSSRNKFESLIIALFANDLKKCLYLLEGIF